MSSDNKPNGTADSSNSSTLESDIAQLTSLLSHDLDVSAGDDTDVAALLHRLTKADGMAQGVEGKLDDILGNLDRLLSSLEKDQANGEGAGKQPEVDVIKSKGEAA
ncbi:hypothetical protein BDQ12DRAFT_719995 [Crucibulum laeve]|uniref:Uncharacterized protein n=1 Tax=Crucibulum laeve TaxID=68775 RepID=A0A5C3MB42_9AGAR|nr:hypothetical protein BDQ12DRAFT_719995 [Crucibulum laeve]